MNEIKTKRLRQADIATMAGVSVSTVSRVLANEPGISESVRHLPKSTVPTPPPVHTGKSWLLRNDKRATQSCGCGMI